MITKEQQQPPSSEPDSAPISTAGARVPAMAWVYLTLSVAGAILPWLSNWDFIQTYGTDFDLGRFIALANANPASQSLARDLAVSATAVTIWIVVEHRRLKMRGLAWVLLSCIVIDVAFAAPLFLYLRERRLAELQRLGLPS